MAAIKLLPILLVSTSIIAYSIGPEYPGQKYVEP